VGVRREASRWNVEVRAAVFDPEESLTNPNWTQQTARSPVTYPSIRDRQI
jgi:hypothetical protein